MYSVTQHFFVFQIFKFVFQCIFAFQVFGFLYLVIMVFNCWFVFKDTPWARKGLDRHMGRHDNTGQLGTHSSYLKIFFRNLINIEKLTCYQNWNYKKIFFIFYSWIALYISGARGPSFGGMNDRGPAVPDGPPPGLSGFSWTPGLSRDSLTWKSIYLTTLSHCIVVWRVHIHI